MNEVEYSLENLNEFNDITKAKEVYKQSLLKKKPRLKRIEYDKFAFLMTLVLTNESRIIFSPNIVHELKDASYSQLDDVQIDDIGESVHWESLNFDIHTKDLIKLVTDCQNTQ